MRIVSSQMRLQAAHERQQAVSRSEQLEIWTGARSGSRDPLIGVEARDRVEVSDAGLALARSASYQPVANAAASDCLGSQGTERDRLALELIELVLRRLTGKDYCFTNFRALDPETFRRPAGDAELPTAAPPAATAPRQSAGWGMRLDVTETLATTEQTDFRADGTIVAADGRELAFAVSFRLTRQETITSRLSLRAGDQPVDPLIISLDALPVGLTDAAYAFDLNSDGNDESIPLPRAGCGFLVFDRNSDGRVDNGAELFGPATGDGFAELKALDADGNGWLDEADPAWQQLGVWVAGREELLNASAAKLGAISVSAVATPFALQSTTGATTTQLGQLRASGVYLREDGGAGLIQQADLVARQTEAPAKSAGADQARSS